MRLSRMAGSQCGHAYHVTGGPFLLVTVRPLLLIPLGFGFRFCRNRTGTGHVLAAEKHDVKKSNCVVLQQSDECGTRTMERVRVEWG